MGSMIFIFNHGTHRKHGMKRIFNRERCETREKSKNPLATFSVFSGLKINHGRHAREMILNRERRETRERVIIGESLPRSPLRDAAPRNAQRRIG